MVSECVVFIVGVIIQLCSFHVWQQFAVGRFISGLGVGALSAAVPMVSDHPYALHTPDPIMCSTKRRRPLHKSAELLRKCVPHISSN